MFSNELKYLVKLTCAQAMFSTEPKFRLAGRTVRVNTNSGFFAREELKTESTRAEDRRAHADMLHPLKLLLAIHNSSRVMASPRGGQCTRSRMHTRVNFPLDRLFIRAVAWATLPTQRGPIRQLNCAGAAEKGLYIAYALFSLSLARSLT